MSAWLKISIKIAINIKKALDQNLPDGANLPVLGTTTSHQSSGERWFLGSPGVRFWAICLSSQHEYLKQNWKRRSFFGLRVASVPIGNISSTYMLFNIVFSWICQRRYQSPRLRSQLQHITRLDFKFPTRSVSRNASFRPCILRDGSDPASCPLGFDSLHIHLYTKISQ